MELSIIIINYNCGKLICGCLETIYAGIKNIEFEIIVVDNQSSDDSKTLVTNSFPRIRWIDMNYNSGFARANNEGIRQSKGQVVLLINPDTLVNDNAIELCYHEFIKEDYVACGVQLLNTDGSPQISGNYAMTGGLNYLLPLPFLGPFIKDLGNLFKVKAPNIPDSKDRQDVDWINGAFLMVKKYAIDYAGLMDEDFFLYAEEAEWCSRLKKSGKLCIYGQYKITHLQGYSSNKTFESKSEGYQNLFDQKGLQIMLSNFVRIRKEFGEIWFMVILIVYIIEIPIFILGVLLCKIFGTKTYTTQMIKNYMNNILYVLNLTPTILKNKKYFYKVL